MTNSVGEPTELTRLMQAQAPVSLVAEMQELARRNERTFSGELRLAMKEHLKRSREAADV
jgi:hypothetical protein